MTFGLYREGAECEYLTGSLEQAEQWFNLALSHTQDIFEKADIYAIKMYLKMTQGENIRGSFEDGLQGLSILGMPLPHTDTEQQAEIQSQLAQLQAKLAAISPSELFDLPEIGDRNQKICMSLLADLWAAAYMGGAQYLSYLSLLLMIDTSLTHGNAEASGFAYCLYGMSLASQGEYQRAYEFGSLALKLDRHFNSTKFIYKTNNIFAHTINPYNRHLKTNLSISRQAFQTSQEGGDVVFGVWAVSFLIWAMIIKGDCLSTVYTETEKYLGYVQGVNDANMLYAFTLQRQFLLNLQDASYSTDLLYDQNSDNESEFPYIQVWREKQNFEHGINWYCFLKLKLSYLYGNYADAVSAAKETEPTLPVNAGFFPIILYHFYYPLSLAALYSEATEAEKGQYWDVLQQQQQIIKTRADNCPENYLHRYLLLSAEMAVISGKALDATDLYDRAIAAAKSNEYTHEEALANELAAKFYLNWNKPRIAREYMIEAYYGYARWGAKTKVLDLERRYPHLLASILKQERALLSVNETVLSAGTVTATSSSSSSISDSLDLAAMLEVSQTLSSEIELDKLISTLLRTVIQMAGASKCVLMLHETNDLMVQAAAELTALNQIEVQMHQSAIALQESRDVLITLVNRVKRSLQPAVILDATAHPQFATDVYIQTGQIKSIVCSPILHQGKLLGMMYLENNLVAGAFTRDRVKLLNLLCAQAAISLENARLYQQAQTYAQQLETSQLQIVQNEKMATLGNLVAGVAHEINNPIGFLNGSINNAIEYVSDLLDYIELYQQQHPPNDVVVEKAEEIDLEFVAEDLSKLLSSMQGANDRIKGISTSLRTFSRADTEHKIRANLHDGLDSTLLILKYRLKANDLRPAIEVIQNYGDLPEIDCFPGQLNQVFMNIMANAIDMFDEMAHQTTFKYLQSHLQTIIIKTAVLSEKNAIEIRISDNGKGMSAGVKAKMFDHLFTTKSVGKGTGLGLAIARQIIVEKHGGSIEATSCPGMGTEFKIILPISAE